jgi:putative Mg2+ transporter-C (MgtC) family protein
MFPNHVPGLFEMAARVGFALVMGTGIGFERQWRAGLAGLRTNALVAVGAALFVLMGAYTFGPDGSADPTRVAAQVVSGIGFLGAGVILREGINIRGLNTAATLWCSAAVGCLAGMGMYLVAIVGTAIIVFANTLLRPIGRAVNRRSGRYQPVPPASGAEYVFEVLTSDKAEPRVRTLLLQTLSRPEYRFNAVTASHRKGSSDVALQAEIHASLDDSGPLERAVARMTLDPKVHSARWWRHQPENEQGEEDEF